MNFIQISKKIPSGYDLLVSFLDKEIGKSEIAQLGFRKNFSIEEFPTYQDGKSGEFQALVEYFQKSLEVAERDNLQSICFHYIPAEYGFPQRETAKIIMKTIHDYFEKNPQSSIGIIVILVSDDEEFDVFVSEDAKIRRNKT